MNKIFTKIGVAFAGIAMAIGVGVAVGQSPRSVVSAKALTGGTTYTMSEYDAGTQYGENETHVLSGTVTLITHKCHFTSELRMYNTQDGHYALLKSTRPITTGSRCTC